MSSLTASGPRLYRTITENGRSATHPLACLASCIRGFLIETSSGGRSQNKTGGKLEMPHERVFSSPPWPSLSALEIGAGDLHHEAVGIAEVVPMPLPPVFDPARVELADDFVGVVMVDGVGDEPARDALA